MRKLIVTIFIICALTVELFSQGYTLQFNQVLILSNATVYTVPANKVWKVESAVYTNYYFDYSNSAKVIIDGTTVELMPFEFYDGNGYGRTPISTAFPMWLPQNTTIQPIQKTSKMFVIEFNLVTP
jgi:hypothetical protein